MTEVPRRTLAESHDRTQSATTAGSPRLRYKRDLHLTRSETAPLFIDLLPAAHRSPASAPAPAHTVRARPSRRRRRIEGGASCGSLVSKRCDVGPDPTAGRRFTVRAYGSRGCAASHSRTKRRTSITPRSGIWIWLQQFTGYQSCRYPKPFSKTHLVVSGLAPSTCR